MKLKCICGKCRTCRSRENMRKWRYKHIEQTRKYGREYRLRPGIREHRKQYAREYFKRPEVIEHIRKQRKDNYFKREICRTTLTFHKPKLLKERWFCERCGSKENLIIHHKVYRYPIDEKDLEVLCRKCHGIQHRKGNR